MSRTTAQTHRTKTEVNTHEEPAGECRVSQHEVIKKNKSHVSICSPLPTYAV